MIGLTGTTTRRSPAASVLGWLEAEGVPAVERGFVPNELIYARGDADRHLCFLLEGKARVYKHYANCKEATTWMLEEGAVFGEPSLRSVGVHSDSCAASTHCRVARVNKDVLPGHLARNPGFALVMLEVFEDWARRREGAISRLAPRGVRSRLAALLLELAEGVPEGPDGSVVLGTRLTHRGLADLVACAREAVSKEMMGFKRDGLIGTRGKPRKIVLLDRGRLAGAARSAASPLMFP